MNWYKRRELVKENKAVSVEIPDLVLEDNHYCTMFALYNDGNTYELTCRVIYNDIKHTWIAHGINPHGLSVIVDIEE